jgi:hypothetical protein
MTDDRFYRRRSGRALVERLFEFLRGRDRILCELRDDGPHGCRPPLRRPHQ